MSEATPRPDLSVTVAGIRCANPVWVASGCYNYGRECSHLYPLSAVGAICTKGTAPEPWPGNPGVRMAETAAGMLNAIGLMNPGIGHYVAEDGPWLRAQGATVIVNIVGRTSAEYVAVAEQLTPELADAVELNISCPNVKEGGLAFGANLQMAHDVTLAVRRATRLPLLVKLSPNVTSVVQFARAVEAAGADGVTLINTLLGMAIDIHRRRPVLQNGFGGLSGPAVKPIALRMVWQVAGAVGIPVIGIGGIQTWQDAVEFLMAGAAAVQVGTACFTNPLAPLQIAAGLESYLAAEGMQSVRELVGLARPKAGSDPVPEVAEAAGRDPWRAAASGAAAEPGGAAAGSAGETLRQWLKDSDRA